ncbi:heme o synthase [Pseudobacteriovorax antillogorgiicola]|uniref:Protoheme IX farnesyltransferase n=1 Tax=Pseudobacteriovorax antillogorgiicola TaxID=1513793 RepID=A0A1Y6B874_9BACT|nr:heme o synthase [Pseudobacteriovorax antillogorgiicola]TCS59318.1 protoheme IX farnesyltransferase [Pseudobacteriovorax antillogorgiicola]SME89442.1 protoheme IX farnesyltransferase [Pseudobacteriovorax antillogorgiicola]
MKTSSNLNSMVSQNDASTPILASIRPIYQMMKPTISLLVVVTVVPTLIMANGSMPSLQLTLVTLLGTYLASGSAGIFNHLADSDIDGHMNRTRSRPLPTGKVSQRLAFFVATFLGIISFVMLYRWATPLAAWVALAANGFYVLVYTMYLKRRTVQNIVIGGAAGAVGPLIGWAAVQNTLAMPAWYLFAVIFLWTPPHFWALAIKYRDDYAKAKIPMMPSVRGVPETKKQIFYYTLSLLPPIFLLFWGGDAGWVYLSLSALLTGYFIWLAYKLLRSTGEAKAMPLFYYSCFYLFGIFGALTLDRVLLL